ncbi:MAG: hypothetical protein ACFFAS_05820 [Promethearchaeota archaeon]
MNERESKYKVLLFELSEFNINVYLENGKHGFFWHNDNNIISLMYQERLTREIEEFSEIEFFLSKGGSSYKDYEGYQKVEDFMINDLIAQLAGNNNEFDVERIKVKKYEEIPPILNQFLFNTQEYVNA